LVTSRIGVLNAMFVAESATAILNLITDLPEIYVHSFEILTAYCQIVGIRLLRVAFLDLSSLNGTAHFYSHWLFKQ
jgi:hypothetical protein